ncbi:glycoside hydrolase family 105 protein [Paenibacillus sp. PAMC21692]|uniref:glycoside hydrolase family 88/105 protein n=1 Tax=Paenibacillus sp. PAMC21692 TaxID=2762320 RepID=UPI00164CFD9A|nr:glycoside hydrolase family 88 protein [Paenibacillus sp. PAMC21692]QNK56156.1 glycoside hydrolase family 88 protein [Paenibacillus sp. PAMC21692]
MLNLQISTAKEQLAKLARYTMRPQERDSAHMKVWQWGQGVALYGLGKTYDALGDTHYLDYMEEWLNSFLPGNPPGKSINTTAPLLGAVKLIKERRTNKYTAVCSEFADWCLHEAPRTVDGAFEHSCTENRYPGEIWADTLFMGCLFLAEWGTLTGERRYIDEAVRQFALHYKFLRDPATGLIVHGYNGNTHSQMGVLWGRGNGWFAAASADMLELVQDSAAASSIAEDFLSHMAGVLSTQDRGGMWHTVMDHPASYPEASCTAAFAYAFLKGNSTGVLAGSHRANAFQAVSALLHRIDAFGRLAEGSGGTCVMPAAADYNAIGYAYSPFTQGLGMMALSGAILYGEEG